MLLGSEVEGVRFKHHLRVWRRDDERENVVGKRIDEQDSRWGGLDYLSL